MFIPLLLMGGIIGRLFREFALTVTASIAVSALVSLTLAPMMCSRFMQRAPEQARPRLSFRRARLRGHDVVLSAHARHRAAASERSRIGVFFATMALTVVLAIQIPKGFFPIQDTGMIQAFAEAAQDTSPEEMMRLMTQDGRRDHARPGRRGLGIVHRQHRRRADRQHRARLHRAQAARRARAVHRRRSSTGCGRSSPRSRAPTCILQPTQDITVGGRIARASFQYTLQDSNLPELSEWSGKMLDKMRTLPQITDVASDLLANAPQLKITINRDQASRFGISPQLIDDTLNDAFGQRQITQYFTQLKTYFVILEILPELQKDLSTLNRLYVKSPLTGGAVPLSSLVDVDSQQGRPAVGGAPGPVPGGDVDVQPSAGRGARRGGQRHRPSRARNPDAVLDHADLPGQRAGVPELAVERADPDRRGARRRLHHPRNALRELHPSADDPFDAAVGRRRRAARAESVGNMDLSVIGIIGIILLIGIVKKNGIMLVDFAISAERERHLAPVDAIREACLLRFRPILMTTAAAMLAGVPLALGHGTGSELRQPLGYAMVGGLAFSQVLTLYTTPVVYLYLDRFQQWLNRKTGPRRPDEEELRVAAE